MYRSSLTFLRTRFFFFASSVTRFLGAAILIAFVLATGSAFAAGGACPSSAPVAGNNTCFFIAANGSDSNNGTSESSPWLHAPGMPKCASNCLAEQTALGGAPGNANISHPGVGFIFRGGDTWHFGNSSASPYTGGIFYIWWGSNSNCSYEGTLTGCFYIGVDRSWYTGASWARPIFTGDNPTSTSLQSSCAYGIANPSNWAGLTNTMFVLADDLMGGEYLDSIEFTGFCSNDTAGHGNNNGDDLYILNSSIQPPALNNFVVNVYMHGATVTTAETTATANTQPNCGMIGGGSWSNLDHVVMDLSDTAAITDGNGICVGMAFTNFYHVKDSIFRYIDDITAGNCHDIHDNIFEYYNAPLPRTHGNMLECNADASPDTANAFYNNIMRHFFPSWSSAGEVGLWFCPNATPEYWFNNIQYDMVASKGDMWSIVGPPTYSGCANSGGQFMFNNTLVDLTHPCVDTNNNTHGMYLTVYNEHLIGSTWTAGTTCTGGPSSASNVSMSDATATTQGYTTGSSGNAATGNTCANDSTTPCAPTSTTSSTATTAGSNLMQYCTILASYTSESAISTDAANACKYGTTDGCSYNSTTHTMTCPAQTAVARPSVTAWNAGVYQYSSSETQPPPLQAPTNLKATAQ